LRLIVKFATADINSNTRLSVFLDGSTGAYLAGYRTNTLMQSAHSVGVQGSSITSTATATAWIGSCYTCYTSLAPIPSNQLIYTNLPRIDIAMTLATTYSHIYIPLTLIPPVSLAVATAT
jgi:hypothetical protein